MIWLQGKAVENPILSKGAPFSQLKAPATVDCDDILSNHYHLPEECLRFLSEGFDELLKCRMVAISTFIFDKSYNNHVTYRSFCSGRILMLISNSMKMTRAKAG